MNKNIKIFINYFFGPLLFAWLAFSIYHHIKNQPQLEDSWQLIKNSFYSGQIFYLVAAIMLIPVNWGIEAWKWKLSVATVSPLPFMQAFKAVLSGVSFSVTMPNRIGEYLGRIVYMPEGSRLKAISVTLVGSFAQLLTTLLTGTIGLVVLKKKLLTLYPGIIWYQFVLYGLIVLVVLLVFFYFQVATVVSFFKDHIKNNKYLYLVEALRSFDKKLLSKILLLSILRYAVFILQNILIFYLFEVQVTAVIILWVMSVVFLVLAVVPSIALIEIGVRGEVSLKLMGMFSSNGLGIGLTSIAVWFINLIVPAIIGSLLLLNIKIFKKKMEKPG